MTHFKSTFFRENTQYEHKSLKSKSTYHIGYTNNSSIKDMELFFHYRDGAIFSLT